MEVFLLFRWLLVILFLLVSACHPKEELTREVEMYNRSGDMIGTALLTEDPEGVKVTLEVEGLAPGFHGFHVHEHPSCKAPDFKSAGNHLNPDQNKHGLLHPEGAHLGDLPNVEADDQGKVDVELIIEDATLLKGKNSLLEDGGVSFIITEDPDDGMSQPGGNSGVRLICGELKSKVEKEDNETPTDPTEIEENNGDEKER